MTVSEREMLSSRTLDGEVGLTLGVQDRAEVAERAGDADIVVELSVVGEPAFAQAPGSCVVTLEHGE